MDWRTIISQLVSRAKTPFGMSLTAHVLLIIALIVVVSPNNKVYKLAAQSMAAKKNVKIVQASIIDQAQYQRQQELRQEKIAAEKRAEQQRIERAKRIQAEKKAALRKAYLKKQAEKKRQQELKQKKLLAEKQRKAKQQKLKQEAEKKKELARRQAIQKQLQQQALDSIKQQQEIIAQRQEFQTEQEKYMSLISQVIRSNWINQFNDKSLKVTLHINLNANGEVESVSITKSSGNSAFDRQAILAVKKASPLPMPKNKELARQFRSIDLPFIADPS